VSLAAVISPCRNLRHRAGALAGNGSPIVDRQAAARGYDPQRVPPPSLAMLIERAYQGDVEILDIDLSQLRFLDSTGLEAALPIVDVPCG
jgi:hypothetical protein